jgi:hypothetical protein
MYILHSDGTSFFLRNKLYIRLDCACYIVHDMKTGRGQRTERREEGNGD